MRLTSTMAARDLERPVNMSKDPAAGAARGDDLDAESLPAAPRLFRVSATAGSTAVAADRAGRRRPDRRRYHDWPVGGAGKARRHGRLSHAPEPGGRCLRGGRPGPADRAADGGGRLSRWPRRAAAAAAPSVASVAGPQSDCHRDSDAGDSGRGPVPRPGRGHRDCQSR